MTRRVKVFGRLLVGYLFFSFSPIYTGAEGAIFYLAPNGTDSGSGDKEVPWATFTHAFSIMRGGDTLYVMDGVYHQSIEKIPSGSEDQWTKIYALNDHQATIDGERRLDPLKVVSNAYVEIRGFRFLNGKGGSGQGVCQIEASQYITLRVSGCWQAGHYKHDMPLIIGSSSHILVEDVWVFGRGRYDLLLFSSSDNTLRRVVARWDDGAYAGEPVAGISIYNSSNNIIENCISLDHHSQNVQGDHSGFYIPANRSHSDNNRFYGNIALNLPKSVLNRQVGAKGFTIDPGSGQAANQNLFVDNVVLNAAYGFVLSGSSVERTVLKNNTIAFNEGDGMINGGNAQGTVISNTLLYKNGGYGFRNNGSIKAIYYVASVGNKSGSFKNASCKPGCFSDDPGRSVSSKEKGISPYKGKGEGGADIGANLVKRYQDGVLTSVELWPWPYEVWIKEDMCNSVGETRGFCAPGTTLSAYLLESIKKVGQE